MSSKVLGVVLCASIATSILCGQTITSSLTGTVRDPSGAVVPGATITAVNAANNSKGQTTSASNGSYLLLGLSPGTYTVAVQASGFKKYEHAGIVLELQQQAPLDISLEVGQTTETVEVKGDVSAIETTVSTFSDLVNNAEILNLPLNTRNVYSLIFLTPGLSGSIGNDYNSLSYSVNGARADEMETLVDGAEGGFPTVQGYFGIGSFPPVDAIAEFKMLDANYPAEFGRSLGNVTNIIYKSGTNVFHGTAFEFLRNSAMDANSFFSNRLGVALPSLKRSQFGGVVDGPIRKNKTFFLFSLEDLRQTQFQTLTTTVPTLLQRQGDFSQTQTSAGKLITIYNPFSVPSGSGLNRTPFPGNVIPASMINPVAANIEKYFPAPDTAGTALTNANNYYAAGGHRNPTNSWDIKIDHSITDAQKFFARFSERSNNDLPANLLPADQQIAGGVINAKDFMKNAVAAYTYTVSPSTIVDTRLAFSRCLYDYINEGMGFSTNSLGMPANVSNAGYLNYFPQISTSGYMTLGNQDDRHNAFMSYSAVASVTRIKGPHTMKFGWDGRIIRVNDHEYRATEGTYSFAAGFTQGPNPNTASSTAGNGFASLLLGTGTGNVIQNFKDVATQSYYFAWYAQDDWRVTKKLTLNIGVRYDLDTPRTERYNRMNYFDPTIASPLAKATGLSNLKGGLVFVGVNGNGPYQYTWELGKIAPRLGLAYQVDPKTVIRAAWAIVYGASMQEADGTVGPFGFRVETDWQSSLDGITPLNTLSNPFPQGFTTAPGSANGLATAAGGPIEGFLQNTVTPYTFQYNFNVQRELPGDVMLEVGYVGNRGLQLQRNAESGTDLDQINPIYLSLGSQLNQLVANPFYGVVNSGIFTNSTITLGQLLRPYPQFTVMVPLYESGANSYYNSLQTKFRKRLSHGLQVEGSYVWSKVIDDGSSNQNSYNTRAARSVASYNIPHRLVVSYIYEIPYGHGRHFGAASSRAVNGILGGWQLNGITSLQSGTPLSISASNVSGLSQPDATGSTLPERANCTGQSPLLSGSVESRLTQYFNTAAFSQPAAFTLGNCSNYVANLHAPRISSTDFAIFKEFHPQEKIRIQFRAEFFNAANHVIFSGPNTSVTSSSFGQISSQSNSPRQTQLGLKILF
jgi:hypothetical protein